MHATMIFFIKKIIYIKTSKKTNLIASSWSNNPNKGFDILIYLDNNLDYSKYNMTYVGSSGAEFKNIISLPPLDSNNLAQVLRKNDIYIIASKSESCSNSMLEALNCGLPVVARDKSSNPEILKGRGELFKFDDIIEKIDLISDNIKNYEDKIFTVDIKEIADEYNAFFEEIILSNYSKTYNNSIKINKITNKLSSAEANKIITFNMKPINKPWGGGNQFLLYLIDFLKGIGYKINFDLSNKTSCVVIVNSKSIYKSKRDRKYNRITFGIDDLKNFKKKYSNVPILQRINDVGIKYGVNNIYDSIFLEVNKYCDFTVFVSEWTKEYFFSINKWKNQNYKVIESQADHKIYNMKNKKKWDKISNFIIGTHHFSGAFHKGTDVYLELDRLIHENKIKNVEFWYIGNIPDNVKFKVAKIIKPKFGEDLSATLKKCNAYISASKMEPGGMHWIEGLQCGLPILYSKRRGGNLGYNNFGDNKGHLYGEDFDAGLPVAIEKMKNNYDVLWKKISNINETFEERMIEEYVLLISHLINKKK